MRRKNFTVGDILIIFEDFEVVILLVVISFARDVFTAYRLGVLACSKVC